MNKTDKNWSIAGDLGNKPMWKDERFSAGINDTVNELAIKLGWDKE